MSPRIRFSRGPGDGPLVGGDEGVGGRGGDGLRGDGGGEGRFGIGVSLTGGGDVVSIGGGNVFDFNFGVIVGNSAGSVSVGIDGRMFTNFCLYGDLISLGLVGSRVGSVRNMRLL